MKKIAGISLTLILIAAAYTVSAWYFGKHVESMVDAQYSRMKTTMPNLSVVKRDFQRGIFESEEIVTLLISPTNRPAPSGVQTTESLELTFYSRYQHGPFPGFSTMDAAVAETELVIPDEEKQKAAEILGGKPPFTQRTEIHFDGSGSASFSSPGFEREFPGKQGKTGHFAWEGLEGSIDFTPNIKSFNLHAQAPKLQLSDDQGIKLVLNDIVLHGNWQQYIEDLPLLTGSSHFSIGKLEASDSKEGQTPVTLIKLDYNVDIPNSGDHIDLVTQIGFQSLAVGNDSIGPAHLDFSFRHLQTQALAEFYQKLASIYSDPRLQTRPPEELAGQLQAGLKPHIETLLNDNPQFNIDRVSFANPDGEVRLSASVKFIGDSLEELANPIMLLKKLDAKADLSLSEEMIVKLLRNPPFANHVGQNVLTPEEISAKGEAAARQFQTQVAMLTEQGYLKRDQGLITTSMTFKEGQITVNGKPFSPAALNPPQQP